MAFYVKTQEDIMSLKNILTYVYALLAHRISLSPYNRYFKESKRFL